MTKAEISQSMLKWSNDNEKEVFANTVLNFINPKFESEEEYMAAKSILIEFSHKCDLTPAEFMLGLEMAADGILVSVPDHEGKSYPVKMFREIDRLKLGEIKNAYQYFKRSNINYEKDKAKIKLFLNPPPEITPEQIKAERLKNWNSLRKSVKESEPCAHAFLFWEWAVKKGAFKNFLQDKEAQARKTEQVMKAIINREKKKLQSGLFNKIEIENLIAFLYDGKEPIKLASERLQAMATVEVKNELVYNFIKKRINNEKID